jgi:hypothetical protein
MGDLIFGSTSPIFWTPPNPQNPGESDIEIFAINLRAFVEASPNH